MLSGRGSVSLAWLSTTVRGAYDTSWERIAPFNPKGFIRRSYPGENSQGAG